METNIVFTFNDKLCAAVAFFSFEEAPFLIFIVVKDSELILEYGEEITIQTNCEEVHFHQNDWPELKALKRILFEAVRYTNCFLKARQTANC